jgi:hypothetical protein
MHRFAVSLLCALVTGGIAGLVAAPAPFPRSPWATGWEKPVDAVGDCRGVVAVAAAEATFDQFKLTSLRDAGAER